MWKCVILFWKDSIVYVIFIKPTGICDLQQPLKAHLSLSIYEFSALFSPIAPAYCKVCRGSCQIGWNNLNISIKQDELPHSEVIFKVLQEID